eukprot:CAMPEP_0183422040 /NCGR_PEP_ID=MMETSP0370-20130417/27514_1 /TAXON_ID=268820 /ORGANISM="Peridinium aciculiferum, Strain PAER-2" /LENGTH=240 /DNA_ID=CAMNT_0025606083 /DNA_START=35 /DNA_END=757 /DNA_ORIENTATION=+
MFPISAEKKQVIKASMGSDLRRLAVDLPANTTAAEAMAAVRAVVAHGFQLGREASSGLWIKYADEDGDLCTLTEHTLEDLVAMAGPKPWRLQVQQQAPLPVPCSSTANVAEPKADDASRNARITFKDALRTRGANRNDNLKADFLQTLDTIKKQSEDLARKKASLPATKCQQAVLQYLEASPLATESQQAALQWFVDEEVDLADFVADDHLQSLLLDTLQLKAGPGSKFLRWVKSKAEAV